MWAREPCGFSGAHPALHIHMRATDHGWEDGQTATLNGPSWALLTPSTSSLSATALLPASCTRRAAR